MKRALVLFVFTAALAFTPVYLLDSVVLPELSVLKQVYGSAESLAGSLGGVDSATAAADGGVDSH